MMLSVLTVLLSGCAGQANVPVIEEKMVQYGNKGAGAYVTIEEEEVPLTAVPQTMEKEESQPMPTQEVEVSLQEEGAATEVVVETENEITCEQMTEEEVASEQAETVADTPAAQEAFDVTGFSADVLQAVNDARAAAGLPGLSTTPELSAAAAQRAAEITDSFSHTRPGGVDYHTAVTEAGGSFGSIGENLFCGMQSVTAIQNAWNGSEVHLENILNDNFAHIGIGVAETSDGVYVVQIFTD